MPCEAAAMSMSMSKASEDGGETKDDGCSAVTVVADESATAGASESPPSAAGASGSRA